MRLFFSAFFLRKENGAFRFFGVRAEKKCSEGMSNLTTALSGIAKQSARGEWLSAVPFLCLIPPKKPGKPPNLLWMIARLPISLMSKMYLFGEQDRKTFREKMPMKRHCNGAENGMKKTAKCWFVWHAQNRT